MNQFDGACHCGSVRYRFRSGIEPPEFRLRECDCSYCIRIRGVYASDPRGELVVALSGAITPYRHGTKTAEFYVCATCGIMPVVISRMQDCDYGVINVRCADAFAPYLAAAVPNSFGAEARDGRLARRAESWIPKVSIDRH